MASNLLPGQFIGDTRSVRVSPGVIVSEVRHHRARRLPRHGHQLAFVSVLLRGQYQERLAPGMTWSYVTGTTGYHPPGFTHDDEIGAGGACFLCIELEPVCVQRLADVAPRVLDLPCLLSDEGRRAGQRLYSAWRGPEHPNPFRLESLLFELLAALVEPSRDDTPRRSPWLRDVLALLNDDPERRWTVEAVGQQIGRHPVHVARAFRQEYGHSIAEHQRRLGLQRACALLADKEATLTEIALRTGFADQSHLARIFKATFGMSPGRYRDELRRGSPRASRCALVHAAK